VGRDLAIVELVLARHRTPRSEAASSTPSEIHLGLRRRAETVLRLAATLQSRWYVVVDATALEAEFTRMQRETVRPAQLEQLIDALGRDGHRIARALVAPALTTRLSWEQLTAEGRLPSTWGQFVEHELASTDEGRKLVTLWTVSVPPPRSGVENDDPPPTGWRRGGLLWGASSEVGAAWSGSDSFHWTGDVLWIFSPATSSWRIASTQNQPPPAVLPAVEWAGTKLLIWGGRRPYQPEQPVDAGGLYDPISDAWTPVAGGPLLYDPQTSWTGSAVLGVGGKLELTPSSSTCSCTQYSEDQRTLWSYSPLTNSFESLAPFPLSGVRGLTSDWTGNELLVASGASTAPNGLCGDVFELFPGDAAAYDPITRTWRILPPNPSLQPRVFGGSVWTGSDWELFGGR
jgi:hypothetical protein